ncbi:MAG TPA: MarC family protein [Stellaceae bacterium]|nr:MarC family protein [Stellaceae bacterium]
MNGPKLLQDFVVLLVAVNPLLVVPEFLTTTARRTAKQKRIIAVEAVLIAGGVLFAFIAAGQFVLEELEVEIGAFRIAAGLILLLMALRMALQESEPPHADGRGGNVAVFPLAMPYMAGPKSIMAVVLLTDNELYSVTDQLQVGALLAVVLAATLGMLLAANWVQRALRDTGISVITRVMGLILAALAVQYILTGIKEAFRLAA